MTVLPMPTAARPVRPSMLRRNVGITAVALVIAWSALTLDIDLAQVLELPVGIWIVFSEMFLEGGPDLSYLPRALEAMVESLQIAWVGTIIGAALSIPLGFFGAKNVSSSLVSNIIRQVLNAIVADLQAEGTFAVLSDVAEASMGPLRTLTVWIVVIGVIVAVAAWISGRRDVRVAVVSAGKRAVQTTKDYEAFAPDSPITDWVTRYSSPLRIAGLVAGLLALLFVASSWLGLVAWAVAVLVFEGLISLLTRQWPFAERNRGDDAPV